MSDTGTAGKTAEAIGQIGAAVFGLLGIVLVIYAFIEGGVIAGLAMLFIGEPILMTVGMWITMLVASPFLVAAARRERRTA